MKFAKSVVFYEFQPFFFGILHLLFRFCLYLLYPIWTYTLKWPSTSGINSQHWPRKRIGANLAPGLFLEQWKLCVVNAA